MQKLTGWGNYPITECETFDLDDKNSLAQITAHSGASHSRSAKPRSLIAHGNGRSYGDSALADTIVDTLSHRYMLSFDKKTGILHAQAGVLLADILKLIVPHGWFLKVTPGTKLITLGGAIASDVHGKNHHIDGCFSESLESFTLLLASGETVNCSKRKHADLFKATCGGMGLTGIILDAKIRLKPINSKNIEQTTYKTHNLKETFAVFEAHKDAPYSVAWIDCLANGDSLGRSHVMTGDFCDDNDLDYVDKKKLSIPFYLPSFTLNTFSVKLFNHFYYAKEKASRSTKTVDIDSFFYPLDRINHWNRIYGKKGFVQYQFILPEKHSFVGLESILKTIVDSGKGSFLAVLKLYGKENKNYLSFPMQGYSLALDFKVEPGVFKLLDELDQIVIAHQGRIYLSKDARMSKNVFESGYPHADTFRTLREKYKMNATFNSLQSQRLEL